MMETYNSNPKIGLTDARNLNAEKLMSVVVNKIDLQQSDKDILGSFAEKYADCITANCDECTLKSAYLEPRCITELTLPDDDQDEDEERLKKANYADFDPEESHYNN